MNLTLHNNKSGNERWSIKYPSIDQLIWATRLVTLYVPDQQTADYLNGHALLMGVTLDVVLYTEDTLVTIPSWFVRIEE